MDRTIKQSKQLGYSSVLYQSDVYDGQRLDTKVIVNDQLLCVIEGNAIEKFHNELTKIIQMFKI